MRTKQEIEQRIEQLKRYRGKNKMAQKVVRIEIRAFEWVLGKRQY